MTDLVGDTPQNIDACEDRSTGDANNNDSDAKPQRQVATAPLPSFKTQLIASLPQVRAFARSLSAGGSSADDLVQEVLVKAWAARDRFQPGSNMKAWLFTITRNEFYDRLRKARNEGQVDGEIDPDSISAPSPQIGRIELTEVEAALRHLSEEQREAIILVGASGFSYEEAAAIAGVATGTMKSRVSRAREELNRKLG